MDKPATAELRAWLKRNLPTMLNAVQDDFDQGLAYGNALLEMLAEPQPAAGKVSREEKFQQVSANVRRQELWLNLRNSAEIKNRLARSLEIDRAIAADYEPAALPEGWEIKHSNGGRDVHLLWDGQPTANFCHRAPFRGARLCGMDGFYAIPQSVAYPFLLACADAIAQAIEEEGGDE